jgi:ankyrin repeat protein
VNINLANNIKNTPLHVAAINNTVTLCKVLVGYNCDVLFKNNIDLNALEMAENFGNAETCEYL